MPNSVSRKPSPTAPAWTLLAVLLAAGCGPGQAPVAPPPPPPEETPAAPVAPAAREREVIEGRIVETGPIGSGACVQRSYAVQPSSPDAARTWVHFERCGAAEGAMFDSLEVNRSYRLTVERGASPNFGDEPMIVDAVPLD